MPSTSTSVAIAIGSIAGVALVVGASLLVLKNLLGPKYAVGSVRVRRAFILTPTQVGTTVPVDDQTQSMVLRLMEPEEVAVDGSPIDLFVLVRTVPIVPELPARVQTVFMVHGGPGIPTRPWSPVEEALKAFVQQQQQNKDKVDLDGLSVLPTALRFVYVHQRGCGFSSRPIVSPPEGGTFAKMGTIIDKLGIDRNVMDMERVRRFFDVDKMDLIGQSFGAFLSVLYAAEFPEHVHSMTLIAPAGVLNAPPKNGGLFGSMDRALKNSSDSAKEYCPVGPEVPLTSNDTAVYIAYKDDHQRYLDVQKKIMNLPTLLSLGDDGVRQVMVSLMPYYCKAARLAPNIVEGILGDVSTTDPVAPRLPGGGYGSLAAFLSLGMWGSFVKPLTAAFREASCLNPQKAGKTATGSFLDNLPFRVVLVHGQADLQDESDTRAFLPLWGAPADLPSTECAVGAGTEESQRPPPRVQYIYLPGGHHFAHQDATLTALFITPLARAMLTQ